MIITRILLVVLVCLLITSAACTKSKPKPLVPLSLGTGATSEAQSLNQRGTEAYQAMDFAGAKSFFAQTIKVAPDSGPAHYNFALALNAIGETEQAHQHFIEAANLAPGDKVIWDSPALRPFGSPMAPKAASQEHPYGTRRPTFGGGPR
jgi:Tfp pilus assembly protein PilF